MFATSASHSAFVPRISMSFPVNAFLAVVSVPFSAQGMVLCSKPRRFTTVSVLLAFRSLATLAALAPSMLLTVWVRGKSSFSLLLFCGVLLRRSTNTSGAALRAWCFVPKRCTALGCRVAPCRCLPQLCGGRVAANSLCVWPASWCAHCLETSFGAWCLCAATRKVSGRSPSRLPCLFACR